MEAILSERPNALFIQSESSEYFYPETEADAPAAEFLNKKRFLSLDLSYGRPVDSEMFRHLMRHGMPEADYDFFMQPRDPVLTSRVMGNDYYATNEHWVAKSKHPENSYHYRQSEEIFGYYVITHQYYERYHLPVMHTETNRGGSPGEARDWLQKQWANVLRLRQDGVPIVGFTRHGLVDLVGWDHLLLDGDMCPVPAGLCGLDRVVREAGECYRELIASWGPLLREPGVEKGTPLAGPRPAQLAERTALGFKALHRRVR